MSRPFRARVLVAVLTLVTAGCQDYNFNPVGHCLIQPGTESFTLSDLSTADVLFVVDDSGSMGGEQARLASAFSSFVQNLSTTNVARTQAGLLPLDFHIAITTTSVFWNFVTSQTCESSCPGAGGQLVCCAGTAPAKQPRRCTDSSQCAGVAGGTCSTQCTGLKGEGFCCSGPNTAAPLVDVIPCSRAGVPCGKLETHYNYAGSCATGSGLGIAPAENGWPYPDGDFVGSTLNGANPRVLHFDKRLYLAADGKNAQGFTRSQLERFFRGNVQVGTCGSGEEQGLQGGRLAVQKALAGQQEDTYSYDYAASLTSTSTPGTTFGWNAATRTASNPATWPSPTKSKIVLVFVGDEDDCASPKDPSGGVVMLAEPAGADACTRDATDTTAVGGKEFPVSAFVDYFTSLGRPVGAAFIVSAKSTTSDHSCSDSSCVADICCDRACVLASYPSQCPSGLASCSCSYDVCGGQAPGTRFVEAAHELQAKGVSTVVGSICDPDFGALLNSIADNLVKPPETLTLPSVPAEGKIAMLRIVEPNGDTRKICGAPLPPQQPTNYTLQQAQDTEADWWFSTTVDPGPPNDPTGLSTVAVPSQYVYINSAKGSCQLNPGETWSLDYIGILPPGGCTSDADCTAKLGGQAGAFTCIHPNGLALPGTCTCSGTTP